MVRYRAGLCVIGLASLSAPSWTADATSPMGYPSSSRVDHAYACDRQGQASLTFTVIAGPDHKPNIENVRADGQLLMPIEIERIQAAFDAFSLVTSVQGACGLDGGVSLLIDGIEAGDVEARRRFTIRPGSVREDKIWRRKVTREDID